MSHHRLTTATLAFALSGFSAAAIAHPGDAAHFIGGMLHPLAGLDHLLAAVAVGLWAARQGLRWLLPATFVLVMLLGIGLADAGIHLLKVEAMIGISVLALGLFLTQTARWPVAVSMLLVAVFALFHGYAHGTEMPQITWTSWPYIAGILLGTAGLHGLGVVSAAFIRSTVVWRSLGCILASLPVLAWITAWA